MIGRKFRTSCRGESSATSYIIILVLVAGVAAGTLTVVDSVESAVEQPSQATTEFEVEQDYDQINLTYAGQIDLTEGNTDVIEITNGSKSMYMTPSDWEQTAGTAIESEDLLVENITDSSFQRGEVVDIIHYSKGEVTESGTLETDVAGTRLQTLTLEERQPRTLEESINISEGDSDPEDSYNNNNNNNNNNGGDMNGSMNLSAG